MCISPRLKASLPKSFYAGGIAGDAINDQLIQRLLHAHNGRVTIITKRDDFNHRVIVVAPYSRCTNEIQHGHQDHRVGGNVGWCQVLA